MKTPRLVCFSVAALLMQMVLAPAPAFANGSSLNCSNGSCDEDEAPCPPDSAPELGPDGGPCVCVRARCVQPVCHYGSRRVLQKRGTDRPGDCCDVYECVQPKEKNCSEIVCPKGVECPADSYRLPGHKGLSDCCLVGESCLCLPGQCPEAECPEGEHAREVRAGSSKPGACCPLFECLKNDSNETCVLDGKETKNGSEWWKDNCTLCKCDNGLLFCGLSPACAEIGESCVNTRIPAGECCPVCADDFSSEGGCMSADGKMMTSGATWQDDPCTTCECARGGKKCQAYMCEVTCADPKYVAGECCPLCDATTVVTVPPVCPNLNNSCSLRCMHGFKRDEAGCITCQCQAEECLLECPRGYAQDSHGNKLCKCASVTVSTSPQPANCPPLTGCRKNCSQGFRLNKAGCEVCKCTHCRPLADCNKKCPHGFRTNDRGCQVCKCQESMETYSTKGISHKQDTHIDEDYSCISTDRLTHDDGEAWFDGCRQCYCLAGIEMCNLITCPIVKCKTVFNSSTDCCPRCADMLTSPLQAEQKVMMCQSVDGAYRVEGEMWQLDGCTKCLCHSGRVLCEAKKCPPAACLNPIVTPGECCPRCPNTQIPMRTSGEPCSVERAHGAVWRDGVCRSCECDSGRVMCFEEECPLAGKCDRPVLAKNWCCSVCLDQTAPKMCAVGTMTYREGEKWTEDVCTNCLCQGGAKFCTKTVCSVACPNPVQKPDSCCQVCTAKSDSMWWVIIPIALVAVLLGCLFICFLFKLYQRNKCRDKSAAIDKSDALLFPQTPPHDYHVKKTTYQPVLSQDLM